jgi:phage terminase Nu1 subunit (DNA packaging protein)
MTDLINTLQDSDVMNADVRTLLENNAEYLELCENIEKAVEESSAIAVVTSSDVAVAANFVSNFKKITREAEAVRKRIVQPLIDKKADIDNFFKGIPQKYQVELKRLEEEILDFQKKERLEAQKKAAEERKRLEEEALNNAIENGRDEPAIIPEIIPQARKISELNTSKVHTRKTKTFLIVNESLIPREYLMPDEAKIKAERAKFEACNPDGTLVKSTIPGIEFNYKEGLV